MSFFATTTEQQEQNKDNLTKTRDEIKGKSSYGISHDETNSALQKADYQGNSDATDGFSTVKKLDTFAENGIQTLAPKVDTPEASRYKGHEYGDAPPPDSLSDDFTATPETDTKKDSFVREDENNFDPNLEGNDEAFSFDIEDIVARARKAGIDISDYFDDPEDWKGEDTEMMLQLLLKDTLEAEMNGVAFTEITPNKGEIHDVSFRTDRVKNDKLE